MKKRTYTPRFKGNVALEVIESNGNAPEVAQKFDLHISLVRKWETLLRENVHKLFETEVETVEERLEEIDLI